MKPKATKVIYAMRCDTNEYYVQEWVWYVAKGRVKSNVHTYKVSYEPMGLD